MNPRIVAFIYGLVDRQFKALQQFIQPVILAFVPGGYVGSFARKVLARQAASHSFVQFRASVSAVYIYRTAKLFAQRVEQMIRELMRTGQDNGCIHDVVVPTERVIELGKGGQKRTTTRKFYPGYVMVRMTMTDLSWHLVQNIPKVTGFVGGKNRPAPMGPGEAERILSLMETRQEQPRPKFNFDRGDEVRVIDGPFGGFNGVVEEVNYDKGKLKVSVSIFGRQTPVELDFIQVTKG